MEQQARLMLRDGVLSVGISLILYKLTASATLFVVPLLFVAPRLQDIKRALVPVVLVLVLLSGYNLYQVGFRLNEPVVRGSLAIGMFLPVALLIGAGVWIGFAKYRMLLRLLLASVFAAVMGFSLVIWFRSGSVSAMSTADSIRSTFEVLFPSLFGSAIPLGMDIQLMFTLVVEIVEFAFLPLFLGQFGLSVMISELLMHRNDWLYQERMTRWQLPVNTVWVFLSSWTLVLATLLFIKVPLVACLAWNTALSVSLLYVVQGVSIASSVVRKRNPNATATRTFVLAFLLVLIPGLNVIPLVALLLLGVSETWIRYRMYI